MPYHISHPTAVFQGLLRFDPRTSALCLCIGKASCLRKVKFIRQGFAELSAGSSCAVTGQKSFLFAQECEVRPE